VVVGAIKANVTAGTTITGNWAAFLVGSETDVFADFAEWLRPMTILGRFGTGGIPSLRNVPFRVPLLSQTAGATGYWVGEAKAKPLTSITGARTTLTPLKVANICVLTDEVIRDSSPKAEVFIRDELGRALMERIDTDFIDPPRQRHGTSPASISTVVTQQQRERNRFDSSVSRCEMLLPSSGRTTTTDEWRVDHEQQQRDGVVHDAKPAGPTMVQRCHPTGGSFFGLPVIASGM
jgi:hypothetical protein